MDWKNESGWEFVSFYNNLVEECWNADGFEKEWKKATQALEAALPSVCDLKTVRRDGTDDVAYLIGCPRPNVWIIDGVEYGPGPELLDRLYT